MVVSFLVGAGNWNFGPLEEQTVLQLLTNLFNSLQDLNKQERVFNSITVSRHKSCCMFQAGPQCVSSCLRPDSGSLTRTAVQSSLSFVAAPASCSSEGWQCPVSLEHVGSLPRCWITGT